MNHELRHKHPSILLQMDYVDHTHHTKYSVFLDSVWRQIDVGRTFFSIQVMQGRNRE